jgi:hypothetical protein
VSNYTTKSFICNNRVLLRGFALTLSQRRRQGSNRHSLVAEQPTLLSSGATTLLRSNTSLWIIRATTLLRRYSCSYIEQSTIQVRGIDIRISWMVAPQPIKAMVGISTLRDPASRSAGFLGSRRTRRPISPWEELRNRPLVFQRD